MSITPQDTADAIDKWLIPGASADIMAFRVYEDVVKPEQERVAALERVGQAALPQYESIGTWSTQN